MLRLVLRTEYRVFGFVLVLGIAAAFLFLTNIDSPPEQSLASLVFTGETSRLESYHQERLRYGLYSLFAGVAGILLLLFGDHHREFHFDAKTLILSRYPLKIFKKILKFEALKKIIVVERYHNRRSYARIANIRVQVGSHTFYTYDMFVHTKDNTIIKLTQFGQNGTVEAYAQWLSESLGIPGFYINSRQRGVGTGEISLANATPTPIPSFEFNPTKAQKIWALAIYGSILLLFLWGYLLYPMYVALNTLGSEGELRHLALTGLVGRKHLFFDFEKKSKKVQRLSFSRSGEDLQVVECSGSSLNECVARGEQISTTTYDIVEQSIISVHSGPPVNLFTYEIPATSDGTPAFKVEYTDELCARTAGRPVYVGSCFMNLARSLNGHWMAIASDSTVSIYRYGYTQPFRTINIAPTYGQGEVTAQLSHDGRYIAIASGEKNEKYERLIRIFDTDTGRPVSVVIGWPRTQAQIAWSPKQHYLAIAEYGSVKVFDATTGRTLRQYGTHDQRNTALAWHPDGKTIYTGGEDRLIHVWQAPR
jgi:hypothetical protein